MRVRVAVVVLFFSFGCLPAIFWAGLLFGCKETPPEPPKPATITLKAEDASCTEAWLKAATTETSATASKEKHQ